jgi:hypothetical protein
VVSGFPTTERAFHDRFADEDSCRDYLFELRWPSGFVCPACGHREAWKRGSRDEWICAGRGCGKGTSLRAGTIFHNSPKPLRDWFLAMFHMVSSKQGISALELQRRLGYGSNRTTLRWLRELRRAMGEVLKMRPQLSGEVECDEMLIGGFAEGTGMHGFSDPGKVIIAGAAERRGAGCGRARMRHIPKNDGPSIRAFVTSVVQAGSMVCSDGARTYRKLPGFLSDPATTSNTKGLQLKARGGSKKVVQVHLARIHRVFSLMKRVVMGCHQGSFTSRHIQGYLDEYCFRFDGRGKASNLGMVRELALASVNNKCVPYWRSSGRVDPRIPTMSRTSVWRDLATGIRS